MEVLSWHEERGRKRIFDKFILDRCCQTRNCCATTSKMALLGSVQYGVTGYGIPY